MGYTFYSFYPQIIHVIFGPFFQPWNHGGSPTAPWKSLGCVAAAPRPGPSTKTCLAAKPWPSRRWPEGQVEVVCWGILWLFFGDGYVFFLWWYLMILGLFCDDVKVISWFNGNFAVIEWHCLLVVLSVWGLQYSWDKMGTSMYIYIY